MTGLDRWRDQGTPRSLLNDLIEVLNDFDRPFEGLVGNRQRMLSDWDVGFSPRCDVSEIKDGYLLSFDMPGVKQEDINVEVKNGMLVVSGERKNEEDVNKDGLHVIERQFGSFKRSFSLPADVNEEDIRASYENGELKVKLTKSEKAQPKKIEVESGGFNFLKNLTKKIEQKTHAKAVGE